MAQRSPSHFIPPLLVLRARSLGPRLCWREDGAKTARLGVPGPRPGSAVPLGRVRAGILWGRPGASEGSSRVGKRGEMGPVGKETGACAGPVCGQEGSPRRRAVSRPSPDSLTPPPPTEKSAQRPAGGVRHAVSNRWGGRRPPTPGNAGCPERRIVCLPLFCAGILLRVIIFGHCLAFGTPPAASPSFSRSSPDSGAHDKRAPGLQGPSGGGSLK